MIHRSLTLSQRLHLAVCFASFSETTKYIVILLPVLQSSQSPPPHPGYVSSVPFGRAPPICRAVSARLRCGYGYGYGAAETWETRDGRRVADPDLTLPAAVDTRCHMTGRDIGDGAAPLKSARRPFVGRRRASSFVARKATHNARLSAPQSGNNNTV